MYDNKVRVGQYINQQKQKREEETEETHLSPFKLPQPSPNKPGSAEFQVVEHHLNTQRKQTAQIEKFQMMNEDFLLRNKRSRKQFNESRIPNMYSMILNQLNPGQTAERGGRLRRQVSVFVQVIDKTVHRGGNK